MPYLYPLDSSFVYVHPEWWAGFSRFPTTRPSFTLIYIISLNKDLLKCKITFKWLGQVHNNIIFSKIQVTRPTTQETERMCTERTNIPGVILENIYIVKTWILIKQMGTCVNRCLKLDLCAKERTLKSQSLHVNGSGMLLSDFVNLVIN